MRPHLRECIDLLCGLDRALELARLAYGRAQRQEISLTRFVENLNAESPFQEVKLLRRLANGLDILRPPFRKPQTFRTLRNVLLRDRVPASELAELDKLFESFWRCETSWRTHIKRAGDLEGRFARNCSSEGLSPRAIMRNVPDLRLVGERAMSEHFYANRYREAVDYGETLLHGLCAIAQKHPSLVNDRVVSELGRLALTTGAAMLASHSPYADGTIRFLCDPAHPILRCDPHTFVLAQTFNRTAGHPVQRVMKTSPFPRPELIMQERFSVASTNIAFRHFLYGIPRSKDDAGPNKLGIWIEHYRKHWKTDASEPPLVALYEIDGARELAKHRNFRKASLLLLDAYHNLSHVSTFALKSRWHQIVSEVFQGAGDHKVAALALTKVADFQRAAGNAIQAASATCRSLSLRDISIPPHRRSWSEELDLLRDKVVLSAMEKP